MFDYTAAMIPLSLQIKNFISYGPIVQTISFEPYPLICLSGKNGHGKSALLDALTWVVWGQARKIGGVSKSDDTLLHLGQTNMFVIAEIHVNNERYRIRREYSLMGQKAVSALDFGIYEQSTGFFRSLTDKTIRLTQEKIISIIGLDYDTFINSVFLRQGQSNEFSKKSPKERKEILSTILGLDRFEHIKQNAHEKIKEFQQQEISIRRILENVTQESSRLTASFSVREQTEQQLLENEKNLAYAQQTSLEITNTLQNVHQQETELRALSHHSTELRTLYDSEKITLINEYRTYKKYHRELLQIPSHFDENCYQNIKAELLALEQKKEISFALAQQLQEAAHAVKTHELTLQNKQETQRAQHQLQLQLLEQDYKKQLQEIEHIDYELAIISEKMKMSASQLAQDCSEQQLATILPAIQHLQVSYERYTAFFNKFMFKKTAIEKELLELEKKFDMINDTLNARCGLCEQSLSSDAQHQLLTKLHCAKKLNEHQLKRLQSVMHALQQQLEQQKKQLEQLTREQAHIRTQQLRKAQLVQEQMNLEQLHNKYVGQQACIMTVSQELNNKRAVQQELYSAWQHESAQLILQDSQLMQLKQNYETIQQQLITVGYTSALHAQTVEQYQKYETLKTAQTRKGPLLESRAQASSSVHRSLQKLRLFKLQIADYQQKLMSLSTVKEHIHQLRLQESEHTQKIQFLKNTQMQLLIQKGALEEQIKQLHHLESMKAQHTTTLNALSQEIEEYTIIAKAMGKDGIQALFIEQALPELEQEANDLLAKLTDNQTHIMIESLKDLKSGVTKETLDIKISDSFGIRAYELFSGGEAFRIDLALRIALSKLLARRAGTTLQTLIIDEGFGSQDEDGLSKIMEALYCIQDNFAKIIIVSHLPSMKEQFPTHLVINKTASGSSVSVIEQG